MESSEALNIRLEQRKKYLEDPKFERLSDILTNEHAYRIKRDEYILLYLLYGYAYRPNAFPTRLIIENTFLEHHKRTGINWVGIYEYYKARSKSINNNEWFDVDDYEIEDVTYVLEKHKDKIFKNYTTF